MNNNNSSNIKRGVYLTVNKKEIARKDYIRELFINGLADKVQPGSRSDIVKYLNDTFTDQKIIFQQVYQATSDLESSASSRGRNKIVLKKKDGSEIARKDLIEELYKNGMSRGDIVRHLKSEYDHTVAFQIVYQATS